MPGFPMPESAIRKPQAPVRNLRIVHSDDVRDWYAGSTTFSEYLRSIGAKHVDSEYLECALGMPLHLSFISQLLMEEGDGNVPNDALDSIPFYSLCRGLFLPLSGMSPEKAA